MARAQLGADFKQLIEIMKDIWHRAPAPDGVLLKELTVTTVSEVEAVALMHGWMTRIIRTGEAALKLNDLGYQAELSPLVRSVLEHAIGLHWVANLKGAAFQVLIRRRSRNMQTFKDAQSEGWQIAGEEAQMLIQHAIDFETDDETMKFDSLGHVAHQAHEYGLGDLYQAWLIETGSSHATIVSALPYFSIDTNTGTVQLHNSPLNTNSEVEASIAIATYVALIGYNKVLTGTPLDSDLVTVRLRLEELGGRLRLESTGI